MAAETSSKNYTSPNYDQIVNLVGAGIGSNMSFPGDLAVGILLKLPVKSLIRFQAVCKPWKLVINSTVFIDNHLHRKNPQLVGYPLYPKEHSSHNIFPVDIIFIVGACNGIICLGTSSPEKRLLLFNPTTKEFSFVPAHGLSSWGTYGFCYVAKTQEYKIISFCHGLDDIKHVDIRTLTLGKSTSLRDVQHVRVPGIIHKPRQVTVGTTMIWLGCKDDVPNFEEIVIFYDVIEERFSKMDVPDYYPYYYKEYSRSLGVLKDSVIMFVSPMSTLTKFFDIWMLIDDVSNDKSWMKLHTVGPLYRSLIVNYVDVCWDYKWILCSKGGDHPYSEYTSNNLFYYNLETKQVEDYNVTDPPIREFVNYEESLVSVQSLVSCIDTNF